MSEPFDIEIHPEMDAALAARLHKNTQSLDWAFDPDRLKRGPQPLDGSGALEAVGRDLWAASGLDPQDLLDRIEEAREDDECVRLIVRGEETYGLPWELIHHDHPELGFLARHPRCILARHLRGKRRKPPTAPPRPFRMLLFIASPDDLSPERGRLDFEEEEALLFTALDRPLARGEIDIDVAEDGFLSTLIDRLSRHRYHALILSMHGTRCVNGSGQDEWGLLFEDERTYGKAKVAGSDLAAALDRLPTGRKPSLTVLAACRSARIDESAEPIADVARQIHRVGFERVVGMRLSVLDPAASAFNAALFSRLALGESVGRAVSLAREAVAGGEWLRTAGGDAAEDPYAQWAVPVLLDRTADGPAVDLDAPAELTERLPLPDAIPGDGTVPLPVRGAFIGRRAETREALRPFLEGRDRAILFTGPGGVGKTALAGLFARHLMERLPDLRVLGFRAPFSLDRIYEPIRAAAFDGGEEPALQNYVSEEPDIRERLRRMLVSLAGRNAPLAVVLDNLETLQDLQTLEIAPEHEESLWLVRTVCGLKAPTRVLLTGRYTLADRIDAPVHRFPVGEAPYADVLRRMRRLHWPAGMDAKKKRWVYSVLGGNHRAIEWAAQLLTDGGTRTDDLMAALNSVEIPDDTPEAAVSAVAEAMRQNLLFSQLRDQLTESQDRLLRGAAVYRVAVNEDGLDVIDPDAADTDGDRDRLVDYALLEAFRDRRVELTYYLVPPVVRELLGGPGFHPEWEKGLHLRMGFYHRGQGEYLTRRVDDYVEAIHHFRKAEAHEEADALAKTVAGFYYRRSNFADANRLVAAIVHRDHPPPPWWALNRYGLCQKVLGFLDEALAAFERALPVVPSREDIGTTLNNIALIYSDKGDSGTALRYLERSLEISREIGNQLGEGTTLNNIGQIYQARSDYGTALSYLESSLRIQREILDRSGEATTLNNIALIYDARGDNDTALMYLEKGIGILFEIEDLAAQAGVLSNMGAIAHSRGDNDTALRYMEKGLGLHREIGDRAGQGQSLNNIGRIYQDRSDYGTALRYLEDSLDIWREIKKQKEEGETLNNIGLIYKAQSDNELALRYLKDSLRISREIGDRSGEGRSLNNIGRIYQDQGDYWTALRYMEKSLVIQREIGRQADEEAALNNIGQIYKARGHYDTALRYLEESLDIQREIKNRGGITEALHNMAHIAWEFKDKKKTILLWSEALDLAMKTQNALHLFSVGRDFGFFLAKSGDPEKGKQLLTMAAQVGRAAGLPDVEEVEAILKALETENAPRIMWAARLWKRLKHWK